MTATLEPSAFFEAEMAAPRQCAFGPGIACVYSAGCPGHDGANEDSAIILPVSDTQGILALADGLGGLAAGQTASKTALEALNASVSEIATEPMMMRTAVLNGFETANENIRQNASTGATTMAVVEIDENKARPYHVGDSAILVIGGLGKIKFQSIPHSPTGYAVEAGLIDENDALDHEHRHLVSNIVGSPDMRIDVGPVITLAPRDTVLIASDGLVDNLHIEEIARYVRKGSLDTVVATLAHEARVRMSGANKDLPSKPDDLTIVAFRLARPPRNSQS